MEENAVLRQAVITWLCQARGLPQMHQAMTDVALATRPEWEHLANAVVFAAPWPNTPTSIRSRTVTGCPAIANCSDARAWAMRRA
jgi:hypothetical protein